MPIEEIIRAWKDSEYRSTLSERDLSLLPPSPVGLVELSDEILVLASGGAGSIGPDGPISIVRTTDGVCCTWDAGCSDETCQVACTLLCY